MTAIDIDRLRELAAQGLNGAEIARRMGRSPAGLRKRAKLSGITIAPLLWLWSPERDARLRELVEAGLTGSQAARELGTTKNAVIGRASRLRLRWANQPVAKPKPAKPVIEFPPHGRCTFPSGHPGEDGFGFCGERIARLGLPYCAEHMRKAYTTIIIPQEAA